MKSYSCSPQQTANDFDHSPDCKATMAPCTVSGNTSGAAQPIDHSTDCKATMAACKVTQNTRAAVLPTDHSSDPKKSVATATGTQIPSGSAVSTALQQCSDSHAQAARHHGTTSQGDSIQSTKNSNTTSTDTTEQHTQVHAGRSQPLRFRVLEECREWLQSLPEQTVAESQPLTRLHSVTTVLQMPSTRQQRAEVQPMLEEWGVPQKCRGTKRHFGDVKQDLLAKVLGESNRLKTLHTAAVAQRSPATAPPPWLEYSAIQTALLKNTKQQNE